MRNKTALVTGAHGFIGRNTSRYFASQGWKVIGMGHGTWSRDEWSGWGMDEWHTCDITLENLLVYGGEPEVIVHCAGSGSVSFSMTHPFQDYLRTVGTSLAILEYVRVHHPSARFVYPSSAAVYGTTDHLPIKEDFSLNPVSMYGVHKKIVEDLTLSYARHFGVASSIVRFFSVYGPGLRKQILWDACEKIKKGDLTFFGTGDETRDWLHINDAVSLLLKASENASRECQVVNGASGKEIFVRDLVASIVSSFPVRQDIIFTGKGRPGDPNRYLADITRAGEWGWKPQTEWLSGVKEYVQWFKKGAI